MVKKSIFLLSFLSFGFALMLLSPKSASAATAGPVDVQQLRAVQGPSAGQVTLWWIPYYASTTSFHIVYGTQSKNYQFSALNIPSTGVGTPQSFTISLLNPGQTYYFALMPIMNGIPTGLTTQEVAISAATGTVVAQVVTTPFGPTQIGGSPIYTATGANPNLFSDPHPFNFTAVTGTTSGTVNLSWIDKYSVASKYDIEYGTTPGVYIYGAWGIPEATSGSTMFTVGALQSGQTYYFSLVAEQGGQTLSVSSPRVAVAR